MTPAEAQAGLDAVTGQIIGMKKHGRRVYGTTYKGRNCRWPQPELDRLNVLRQQADAYRKFLAKPEGRTDDPSLSTDAIAAARTELGGR